MSENAVKAKRNSEMALKLAVNAEYGAMQTDLPCWFQSVAQVHDVLSPEFMQRQEKLVSAMTKTVMLASGGGASKPTGSLGNKLQRRI